MLFSSGNSSYNDQIQSPTPKLNNNNNNNNINNINNRRPPRVHVHTVHSLVDNAVFFETINNDTPDGDASYCLEKRRSRQQSLRGQSSVQGSTKGIQEGRCVETAGR